METTGQDRPATVTVASPREGSFEAPEKGLQQQFEEHNQEKNQDTSSTVQAILTEDALGPASTIEQQEAGTSTAREAAPTGSSRGGIAVTSRGKGRGGARGSLTASAKGSRGGKSAGGANARGGSKASARGGARGGRGGAAKGKRGSSVKTSKASLAAAGVLEASGSGNVEIAGNTIGSGPSNTIFPLARVSRIVKVDKEIEMTSKDAIWTIAVATELFIKHLTDSAYAKARLDKKKTVTFKELALAVESQNEFFFLQDIIPQPVSFAKAMDLRQEVEERNHMREAGLFDDEEDEEVQDAAPLLNQSLADEIEDGNISKDAAARPTKEAEVDEQGDMAMDVEQKPKEAFVNGHNDAHRQQPLLNGSTISQGEEMTM